MPTLNPDWARRHRPLRPLIVACLAVIVCVWCHDAEAPTSREVVAVVECPAVVDVRQDGTATGMAGRSIPAKPEEWQQTKPCRTERDEVELSGACYVELARKPPCKAGQYETAGKCWAAVARQRRPNTSINGALDD